MKRTEIFASCMLLLGMYLCLCMFYCIGIASGVHEGVYMPLWHWPIKLCIALFEK